MNFISVLKKRTAVRELVLWVGGHHHHPLHYRGEFLSVYYLFHGRFTA